MNYSGSYLSNTFLQVLILKKAVPLFLILFLNIVSSQNSSYVVDHLKNESDITQNVVKSILTDDKGFLWIGKMDGLYRYDGYGFKTFLASFSEKNNLSNPYIEDIEKHNESLIIGTRNGLNIFNLKTQTFTHIFPSSQDTSFSNAINSLKIISENKILIGTKEGLLKLERREKDYHFTRLHLPDSANVRPSVQQIIEVPQGYIICTSKNLFYLDKADNNPKEIALNFQNNIENPIFNSVYITKTNHLLIATSRGIFYINQIDDLSTKKEVYPISRMHNNWPPIKRANLLLEDDFGSIIVGTEGEGVYVYNIINENWHNYRHEMNSKNSLKNDFIRELFVDSSGAVFVGSDAGINTLIPKWEKFELLHSLTSGDNEVEILNAHGLLEDNDKNLWIGTRGNGLFIVKKNRKNFINLKTTALGHIDHINVITKDNQGKIWVGANTGIYIVGSDEFSSGKLIEEFKSRAPDLLPGETPFSITQDRDSNMWISSGKKLYCYTPDNILYRLDNLPNFKQLQDKTVSYVIVDSLNRLWFGTLDGLLVYIEPEFYKKKDLSSHETFKNIPLKSVNVASEYQNFFENYEIYSLLEVSHNEIFVGTNFGLCKVDFSQNQLKPYFEDGDKISKLKSNYIYGLLHDDVHSTLWASTNRGLISYNLETKEEKQYLLKDGLQSLEFNAYSTYKNDGNELFFGGANGINILRNFNNLQKNQFVPQLALTKLIVNGQNIDLPKESDLLDENIAYSNGITLPWDKNNIGFEFASLHFPYAENNSYKCKLEGIDEDWIPLEQQRSINYANLPQGTYSFKLLGTNNDGIWNTKELVFNIVVLPIWYKSWWMMIIWFLTAIVLISIFVWFLLKIRDSKNALMIKELESKQLLDTYESKLVFFTNLSHEFRTPLSLIIDPFQSLMAQKPLYSKNKMLFDVINNNVDRLKRLMDQIMDFRKFEYGKLALKITGGDIVTVISDICSSFLHRSKIKKIDFKVSLPTEPVLMYFDKDSIEKIVYNLLSNAFKATANGGKISIKVGEIDATNNDIKWSKYKLISGDLDKGNFLNHIFIEVKDNGIGISPENLEQIFTRFYQDNQIESGTGIGLYMVKQFTEMHYGSIFVRSKKNHGSTFIIVLPKNDDLYEKPVLKNNNTIAISKHFDDDQQQVISVLSTEYDKDAQHTVVIIEDNDELRLYLETILATKYRIFTANNGLEGIDLIRDEMPDLIVSDVMMPEIDGLELCKRIKDDFETSHIPVILLTAKTFDNQIIEGIKSGADVYLTKPFNKDILIANIDNLIKNREKLRLAFQNAKILEPSKVTVTSIDEKLIIKLKEYIEENIQNQDLTLEMLATEIGVSRAQLFRKVKALTGLTPNNFIKAIRLKYAAKLLENDNFQITEVAFLSGFNEASYFSRCFKESFGHSPKEYKKSQQEDS